MNIHQKITAYIAKKEKWQKELKLLRSVFSELPLEETIKWGAPTYAFNNKNVVGLAAFKNYCGLWFFQGALLKDAHKVLMNAQEGKTKAMLQWRFYTIDEIDTKLIKKYTLEAIENVKAGKEIKPVRNKKPLIVPTELENTLNTIPNLKESFNAFSLSVKREYADYISGAKRVATKEKRLEKIIPMILEGKGLHDLYKKKG